MIDEVQLLRTRRHLVKAWCVPLGDSEDGCRDRQGWAADRLESEAVVKATKGFSFKTEESALATVIANRELNSNP